jgi:hypothetical protein
MSCIFALCYITHIYAASEPLCVAINRIDLGVLLLTIRTRHFPLSYEGVHGLEIGVD